MSSGATNLILASTPLAATSLSTSGVERLPVEWSFAVQVLAGSAVLLAIIAQALQIWKTTRPVPPVAEQIRAAVAEHAAGEASKRIDCREAMAKEAGRVERRLDAIERNVAALERAAATLEERSRRNP